MKIRIYNKERYLNGEKIVDIFCRCPQNGLEIQCSDICIKCKYFRWFQPTYIGCNYMKENVFTLKKKCVMFEYHIQTLPKDETF